MSSSWLIKPLVWSFTLMLLLGAGRLNGQEAESEPKTPEPSKVAVIRLAGSLPESPVATNFDGAPIRTTLKVLLERIEGAAKDEEIEAVILDFDGLNVGPSTVTELREVIATIRSEEKPVFARLRRASTREYLVASAADEIVMPESGTLNLRGLAAEVIFYKGLFDKLGIQADIQQAGESKGTGEPYTRTSMSPAFREDLESMLGDVYDWTAELIAERLGITIESAEGLIDGGPYDVPEASKLGLVNSVAYDDQLDAIVAGKLGVEAIERVDDYGQVERDTDFSGFAGLFKMLQAMSGQDGASRRDGEATQIAVVYAEGTIIDGKSRAASLLGGASVGSRTMIEALRKADEDDSVRAIVLRIDSPGGDAMASDLIWRELVRIEKPIVASMANTAASGGYYIAMACDEIFAEPGTVTGSIGVVGGKVSANGLLDKVGLNVETVRVGRNGALESPFQPFDDQQRQRFREQMEATYRMFVEKAADGRGMAVEEVLTLAGGRVYTGRQALRNGLIDQLGTLDEAIDHALELADIEPDTDVQRVELPEPPSLFESLFGSLDETPSLPGLGLEVLTPAQIERLPDSVRHAIRRLGTMIELFDGTRVLATTPYELRIH